MFEFGICWPFFANQTSTVPIFELDLLEIETNCIKTKGDVNSTIVDRNMMAANNTASTSNTTTTG